MLAQVTYIPKFIMADSEDEFMPIVAAASAAFVATNPKHLPAGRRFTLLNFIKQSKYTSIII